MTERQFRPNITRIGLTPDTEEVTLTVAWQDDRRPEAYAHTAVLSGPYKRLWRVTVGPEPVAEEKPSA